MGMNFRSLQMASRIKEEYPEKKITIIDQNEKNLIKSTLGEKVYYRLLRHFKTNGIEFLLQTEVNPIENEETFPQRKIEAFRTQTARIPTDLVLIYPNNFVANTVSSPSRHFSLI